jgi:peptide chain release factor subunit 3
MIRKEHLNIIFIGHVDSGKSTLSGQILLQTGKVDQRTIEACMREAKEKNRESWYLAYIMDSNEEERDTGKTVHVGRASFETDRKRYTLLDAPGHKSYVPNMLNGVSQADVGILIISARRGEFESGFERGGQTREHTMLARTMGISHLIIAINKMDESTVMWSQERYNYIVNSLTPYLRKMGYKQNEITFLPLSGYSGANVKEPVDESICPWLFDRRSLLNVLDQLDPISRDLTGPLRMPVVHKYKGTAILTKIASGIATINRELIISPTNKPCRVTGILVDEVNTDTAVAGENAIIELSGIEEQDMHVGFVIGENAQSSKEFECQLVITDTLENIPVITAGYGAILHIHNVETECKIVDLISQMNKKTGKKMHQKPMFVRAGDVCKALISVDQTIAIETFGANQHMGRFTLRDMGKTVAIGKITKLN